MRGTLLLHTLILCLLLALTACSFLEQRPIEEPNAPDSRPASTDTPASAPDSSGDAGIDSIPDHALTEDENNTAKIPIIRRHLEAGEFIAALDLSQPNDRQENCSKELAMVYRRAINGVINQGASRLAENKPGDAGLLFRAALNRYPQNHSLAKEIIWTRSELESKIEICAEKLMEQGLTVYREGHLTHAIELWEKILAFDPGHQASWNAIRTAHTQLDNLEKINGAPGESN